MKILLASHAFAPSVGGIETCSLDLAQAFTKLGHEVRVLTQTRSNNPADDQGFQVVRRPGKSALFRALRWCDVFFQNNVSLQTAWPLLFLRKPWVVCTQTWLAPDGPVSLAGRLKGLALRLATNTYISQAICDHVGHRGFVVPNPYNRETFKVIPGIQRGRSLIFLGRLVSDKGCDLLIKSVARLRAAGLALPLTIVGTGPEEAALKGLVQTAGLNGLVKFAGVLRGEDLAAELNRHEVLVVPSRWKEPFGIVALEGIACGCLVVASAAGGLPDAIGACGVTFTNGDEADLARALRAVFEKPELAARCRQAAPHHLQNHTSETVAGRYVEIFRDQL